MFTLSKKGVTKLLSFSGRGKCKRDHSFPLVSLLTFKQGTHKQLVFCTNSEKKTITLLHNCIHVEKFQFCTKVGVSSLLIVVDKTKLPQKAPENRDAHPWARRS